jgi:hypothetical protein
MIIGIGRKVMLLAGGGTSDVDVIRWLLSETKLRRGVLRRKGIRSPPMIYQPVLERSNTEEIKPKNIGNPFAN